MQCLPTARGLPFKQDAVFGMSARCSSLGQNTPPRVVEEGLSKLPPGRQAASEHQTVGTARTHKSRSMSNGWSMSALPPKADVPRRNLNVRFGPEADSE